MDMKRNAASCDASCGSSYDLPYIKGGFRHILSPPGQKAARVLRPDEQWYINDGCFFAGSDKRIHWFGITNPYPPDNDLYGPGSHRHIGHASAESPFGPWEEHEHALALPAGSTECIGACFVIEHEDGYIMLYGYNSGLYTAKSSDLHEWRKCDDVKNVYMGIGTRDPCIIRPREDEGKRLLYTAVGNEGCGAVAISSSRDMMNWTNEGVALQSDVPPEWGPLESPFVLYRGGLYYLFVNFSHRQYEETLVFVSPDPYRFDWSKPECTLFAHAAEIFEFDGKHYISHCGIEDRHWGDIGAPYGLWLAELGWMQPV